MLVDLAVLKHRAEESGSLPGTVVALSYSRNMAKQGPGICKPQSGGKFGLLGTSVANIQGVA